MAEVFKCRQSGIGGFEKLVVIKRILPHLVDDEAFVAMFLDEARIAANLSHPNIVQVFEIERDPRGVPYIVMEYVAGPTLGQLVRQAHRLGRSDLRHMTRLLEGAARGLHHAHEACDADGRPLRIVHRDISVQNILITPDGLPKLADFGVARAEGRLTHTQSGVVKGKVRYTPAEVLVDPEHGVRPRSDVFGLGVCLYLATTGQYPFNGPNDLAVMDAIRCGTYVRPSGLVPGYPLELDEVVAALLERDPARRCQTALAAADLLKSWRDRSAGSEAAALAPWVAALSELSAEQPPPPPEPTGEQLDSIEVLLSNAATPSARPASRWWALAGVGVLSTAMAYAVVVTKSQAEEARQKREQRAAWLDEADRQLAAGRFARAEELLHRGAAVPDPETADELRVAQLEADLRFERSCAAARAAIASGELEVASTLVQMLLSLDASDERAKELSREIKAIEASRSVTTGEPVVAAPASLSLGVRRSARVASGSTASPPAPDLSTPSPEAAAVVDDAVPEAAPASPPPPPRPVVRVERSPRDGRPGLHVTASVRAQVFLDGLPMGWTPLELSGLNPATYLVMVWTEGYESLTERIVLASGEEVSLDFPLRATAR